MPVTVNFRGPILFVHDGERSIDVRIPDCGNTDTHLDGERAERHSAGILLLRNGGKQYFDLNAKCELTITDAAAGGAAGAILSGTFKHKVALDRLVSAGGPTGSGLKLGPANAPALLVRITLVGGQLDASNSTPFDVSVPYQLGNATIDTRIPLLTSWTCAGGATIEDGPPGLDLADGDEIYFYNWENSRPSGDELEQPMSAPGEDPTRPEADFKWLYLLLVPPKTWPEWIEKFGRGALPAPESFIVRPQGAQLKSEVLADGMFYPPNSACDGASWHEPP